MGGFKIINSSTLTIYLFNVGGVLGTSLQEGDAQLVGVLLGRGVVHHLLVGQVALVSHQQLVHVFTRVTVDFLNVYL